MASHAQRVRNVQGAVRRLTGQMLDAEQAEELVVAAGWPEVMGAQEVSDVVGRDNSDLRKLPGLPEAKQTIATGRLWDGQEVRTYESARRRKRATLEGSARAEGGTQ